MQPFAIDDDDVDDPWRIAAMLEKAPMQLKLDTTPGQGPRWVRQVFVHLGSPYLLQLPHSNMHKVQKYADGYSKRGADGYSKLAL